MDLSRLWTMETVSNLMIRGFLSVMQKFQKIEEEHLKVIISYLEQYIESQKTGQVHVEAVNIESD